MLKAHAMNSTRRETLLGLEGIYYSLQDIEKSEEYRRKYEALDQGSPQEGGTDTAGPECLMATESEWKAIGLSVEQLAQVKSLQERALREGADATASLVKELRTMILTPEQAANWQKWCAGKQPKDK
jgi:hypothetical protein